MSHMFNHGGIRKIDWFSETLFKAFNNSITTKTDNAMVIGCGSSKMPQSTPSKSGPPPKHCMKWVNWYQESAGPSVA